MSTVLQPGPCRRYGDRHEPMDHPSSHVDRGGLSGKRWPAPVGWVRALGFGARELAAWERRVQDHPQAFVKSW